MSFSAELKEELSKLNNLSDKGQVVAEFMGYISTINTVVVKKRYKLSTESQYNINRYSKLLRNLDIDYDIEFQGKVFSIICNKKECDTIIDNDLDLDMEVYKKSYVRGAFMGGGSINDPNNTYHLEIILENKENAYKVNYILQEYGIYCKTLERKKGYSIYIKDGEEISKFLAFIGASKAVLKFEEIRVVKETRNNVNRLVNCETANLDKTINASVEQINAIEKLIRTQKLNTLSKGLQEMANLRIENPEATLVELGNLLTNPIGKSGVNHRLKKLIDIAEYIDE